MTGWLARRDPRARWGSTVLWLVLAAWPLSRPAQVMVLALTVAMAFSASPARRALRWCGAFAAMGVLTWVLDIALSPGPRAVATWPAWVPVSKAGVPAGFAAAIRVMTLGVTGALAMAATTRDEAMDLAAWVLAPCRRVPGLRGLDLSAGLAVASVPLVMEELRDLRLAARFSGRARPAGWRGRLAETGDFGVPLLVGTLHRAAATLSHALEARLSAGCAPHLVRGISAAHRGRGLARRHRSARRDDRGAGMSAPRRVRFLLAYDGTGFHGWQRQVGDRSIQGEVEAALASIVGAPVGVVGAGRTDAGAHAVGQVAHAELDTALDADTLRRALNARLPRAIRVRAAEEAAAGFHARFSAVARRYEYRFITAPHPIFARFAHELPREPDATAIRAALPALLGRHDFLAVARPPEDGGGTQCEMFEARWARWQGGPRLILVANRFLRGMVRTIAGTLVEIGRGRRPPEDMARLLAGTPGPRAGAAAPAHGLCLVQVRYAPHDAAFAAGEAAGLSRRTKEET